LCVAQHDSDLPRDFDALAALPGIGRSTAGAILAQAHGLRLPILDGNVKRVLARWRGVTGWPGATETNRKLWTIAEMQTPRRRIVDYTQAIMDLGATLCMRSRPRCADCPLAGDCIALARGLTAKLPERKPARKIPTRSTIMLVLRDTQGRLLIERRPPTGVWAGLWSLPEAADAASARRDVARYGGHTKAAFAPLPPFVHGFSHYRLEVTPLALRVAAGQQIADDPDRRWLQLEEAATLGLPAPVRKLIASLPQSPA
jgi:A/G-specific adenine glycosylase